ncbi:hypothetical protein ACFXOY_18140 [Streptomyces niveus]|uniref:hypothetical protein n=1 Tax=Streptomyces niveus TaxID=193462 RepID=UPI0036CF95D3
MEVVILQVYNVHHAIYVGALRQARRLSELIAGATSRPEEMPADHSYYLTDDFQSGFGVAKDGTLVGLFSLIKGRGEELVWDAVAHKGAKRLDCFDGFLTGYYRRFGFAETERIPNWTSGEPDVVFMSL